MMSPRLKGCTCRQITLSFTGMEEEGEVALCMKIRKKVSSVQINFLLLLDASSLVRVLTSHRRERLTAEQFATSQNS